MRSKIVNSEPRTFVIVFDPKDEVVKGIEQFCKEANVEAASLTAIGAFSSAALGYFDIAAKKYRKIPVDEQVEVLSIMGDIISYQGEPKLHAHAVIGKADGTAHGGHLLSAIVNPTLEVVITELPAHLRREMNEQFGIPLIKL